MSASTAVHTGPTTPDEVAPVTSATVVTGAPDAATTPSIDPDIAQLRSMFPDIDETVLDECYVAANRNVNSTIEFLLGTEVSSIVVTYLRRLISFDVSYRQPIPRLCR